MSKAVYILYHWVDERDESSKIIGVFDSENLAKGAIEEIKDKPGFADRQEGFLIDKYTLNRLHWTEGFGVD